MTRKKHVTLKFNEREVENLEVALRLRIEALDDNGDPDKYGWKPLHKRLVDARREIDGLLVRLKRKVPK